MLRSSPPRRVCGQSETPSWRLHVRPLTESHPDLSTHTQTHAQFPFCQFKELGPRVNTGVGGPCDEPRTLRRFELEELSGRKAWRTVCVSTDSTTRREFLECGSLSLWVQDSSPATRVGPPFDPDKEQNGLTPRMGHTGVDIESRNLFHYRPRKGGVDRRESSSNYKVSVSTTLVRTRHLGGPTRDPHGSHDQPRPPVSPGSGWGQPTSFSQCRSSSSRTSKGSKTHNQRNVRTLTHQD